MGSILTDQFFRRSTGTVMTGYEITQLGMAEMEEAQKRSRFEWFKLYIPALDLLKSVFGSPRFDVFAYVVLTMDRKTNEFNGSRNAISKAIGVSPKTVERTVADMERLDIIRRVKRSVWMVNPKVAIYGRKWKEAALSRRYEGYSKDVNVPYGNFLDSGIPYDEYLEE